MGKLYWFLLSTFFLITYSCMHIRKKFLEPFLEEKHERKISLKNIHFFLFKFPPLTGQFPCLLGNLTFPHPLPLITFLLPQPRFILLTPFPTFHISYLPFPPSSFHCFPPLFPFFTLLWIQQFSFSCKGILCLWNTFYFTIYLPLLFLSILSTFLLHKFLLSSVLLPIYYFFHSLTFLFFSLFSYTFPFQQPSINSLLFPSFPILVQYVQYSTTLYTVCNL